MVLRNTENPEQNNRAKQRNSMTKPRYHAAGLSLIVSLCSGALNVALQLAKLSLDNRRNYVIKRVANGLAARHLCGRRGGFGGDDERQMGGGSQGQWQRIQTRLDD